MSVSDPIKAGQLTIRYLVDGSASRGLGIFELEVPPGSNVPPPQAALASGRYGLVPAAPPAA